MERPVDGLGENLMFLISQPRSGSTLLQHLLAGHPRIHTLPEPWFMLHLLYADRPDGIATEYDARTAHRALRHFLESLESGDMSLLESVRAAAGHLYGKALSEATAEIFLDKTPRYYLIAEGLREVFPRARMIFLIRNPLAVFSSILHTHSGGDWTALRRLDQMHDLITAPRSIMRAIDNLESERTALVRYEELVNHPDTVLSELCGQMEIEYLEGLKRYIALEAPVGDRTSTVHNTPVTEYIDRWTKKLDSAAKRDVARSYLGELGPDLVRRLGYDYDQMVRQLSGGSAHAPGSRWPMLVTPDELLPWWVRLRLGFAHSTHQRGLFKTLLRLVYIAIRGRAWATTDPRNHIDRRPV